MVFETSFCKDLITKNYPALNIGKMLGILAGSKSKPVRGFAAGAIAEKRR